MRNKDKPARLSLRTGYVSALYVEHVVTKGRASALQAAGLAMQLESGVRPVFIEKGVWKQAAFYGLQVRKANTLEEVDRVSPARDRRPELLALDSVEPPSLVTAVPFDSVDLVVKCNQTQVVGLSTAQHVGGNIEEPPACPRISLWKGRRSRSRHMQDASQLDKHITRAQTQTRPRYPVRPLPVSRLQLSRSISLYFLLILIPYVFCILSHKFLMTTYKGKTPTPSLLSPRKLQSTARPSSLNTSRRLPVSISYSIL